MTDNLERLELPQADRPELVPEKRLNGQSRYVGLPRPEDKEDLGPYRLLPGTWRNVPKNNPAAGLDGRGWSSTPLPFADPPRDYRLLNHRFNEELKFTLVDNDVPNRGIRSVPGGTAPSDQLVLTLDYEQVIAQVVGGDNPSSGLAGNQGDVIHHEPGLFLHMLNETEPEGFTVARLGTIPHGDAVMALGTYAEDRDSAGPQIPAINGLPVGVRQDLENPYLAPYKHFHDNPFDGSFDPTRPHLLLERENFAGTVFDSSSTITSMTTLQFDTTNGQGGIHNIPFVVRQANAAEMRFTMWIMEVVDTEGTTHRVLQYAQVVFLDFFPTFDGTPGRIRWPHVAINTLVKDGDDLDPCAPEVPTGKIDAS